MPVELCQLNGQSLNPMSHAAVKEAQEVVTPGSDGQITLSGNRKSESRQIIAGHTTLGVASKQHPPGTFSQNETAKEFSFFKRRSVQPTPPDHAPDGHRPTTSLRQAQAGAARRAPPSPDGGCDALPDGPCP